MKIAFSILFLLTAGILQAADKPCSWEATLSGMTGMIALGSCLLLLCACASKLSSWFKTPCLLIFLGVGMLAGEEGFRVFEFDNAKAANVIGSIAMAFILFSGGFSTRIRDIKKAAVGGILLSTLGVLLTAFFMGICAYCLLQYFLPEMKIPMLWCMVLGVIVSSTDAAAVFSILRSRSVHLNDRLQPLLELESGSNDPMAVFLTLFMVGLITTGNVTPDSRAVNNMMVFSFMKETLLGLLCGFGWAFGAKHLFNKIDLEYDGLYYVLAIGVILFSFGVTDAFGGNGYLAVYVTGIFLGNEKFIYHNGIGRFSEGMAWLAQVVLFCMLGLLVTPSLLWKNVWLGCCIALSLMVIARPAAVMLCLFNSKYTMKERLLASWVGLRGGAPIMLATFPMIAGVRDNSFLFHLVFFIVLFSVLVQGITIMPLAKLLHLDLPLKVCPRVPLEFDNTGTLNGDTREFEILETSPFVGKTLAKFGLPKNALVLLVRRGGDFIVPHGDTVIEKNDSLMVLGTDKVLDETAGILGMQDEEETEK